MKGPFFAIFPLLFILFSACFHQDAQFTTYGGSGSPYHLNLYSNHTCEMQALSGESQGSLVKGHWTGGYLDGDTLKVHMSVSSVSLTRVFVVDADTLISIRTETN